MRNIRIAIGFLSIVLLAAGCRSTAAVTPAQNITETITGTVQAVTATNVPDRLIVSIDTGKGTQNISVSKNNTSIAVEGEACTLDDINLFNIQGRSYNCTAVYNPGCDADAIAFNVVKIVP